ncbi:MAG TPA: tetratricopeptide repeat protein [Terriglobales bacterium]
MGFSRKLCCAVLFAILPCASIASSATTLLEQGRVDEAISEFQNRVNKYPNEADSYNLLCRAYFQLGEWDRGISACERATALDPSNGIYHLWLGRVYGEKADSASFITAAGLAKKVRQEFEVAVRLAPNNADARNDLAEFYLEAPGIVGGGRDKAENQAQALANLDPARADWIKGRIAEKNKEYADAEKEYQAAIQDSHGGAHAWFNLALYYWHRQDLDNMQKTLYRAVAAPMDRQEVIMESAELLIRGGRDFPAAVQWLNRYLNGQMVEEAPAFKAHYLLGSVLEKQGKKDEAIAQYQAALALAKNFSRAQQALSHISQ